MVTIPHLLVDVFRMLPPYPHPRPSKRGSHGVSAVLSGSVDTALQRFAAVPKPEVETSSGHGLLSPRGANTTCSVPAEVLACLDYRALCM